MVEALTAIILVGLTAATVSVYLNENNSEKRSHKRVLRDGFVFTAPDGKQERIQCSHCSSGSPSSSSSTCSSSSSTCDHNIREPTPLSSNAASPLSNSSAAKMLKRFRKRNNVGTAAINGGTLHGLPLYIESECAICLEELLQPGVELLALGCAHTYHRACIMEHLHGHHFCPICKVTDSTATFNLKKCRVVWLNSFCTCCCACISANHGYSTSAIIASTMNFHSFVYLASNASCRQSATHTCS
jgi:Ring finger domain